MRQLLLSGVVVVLDNTSALQTFVAVVVCWWAHALHSVYKPWAQGNYYTYMAQHGALFVTTVCGCLHA